MTSTTALFSRCCHRIVIEAMKNEARIIAHTVGLVVAKFEGRHLLLSGAPDLQAAVVEHLPKAVQQRVGAEFIAEVQARPADVAAAAEPAQRAIEAREESATIQRLLDAGPQDSAWGEQPTHDALREGRVMTLVVDGMFQQAGRALRELRRRGRRPARPAAALRSRKLRTSSSSRSSRRSRKRGIWNSFAAMRRGKE